MIGRYIAITRPPTSAPRTTITSGSHRLAIIAAIMIALPVVNEVLAGFPAAVLWKFRTTALGMQAIMWATIGLLFGGLVERSERIARGSAAGKKAYQ